MSNPSTAARIAALSRVAQVGGLEVSRPAREKFLAGFELEVDPDGVLPPEERAKRATALRRAYFTRLAAKSAASRRASAARSAESRKAASR